MSSSSSSSYIPSLDGFRALSITIVFLGHSFKNLPIPGGLGVTIFFFISGYLITTLLLREFQNTGKLDFKEFYIRRLFRLMPPLLVTMLLGVVMVSFGWAEGTLAPMALLSQVFFFYNYWDTHHVNDGVSGLGILWSLSVEEHFYLVFPALFLATMKKNWKYWWMIILIIFVLIWRIVKFSKLNFSEWEIYALTDTRIDSIIWGCFLAVLLNKSRKMMNDEYRRYYFSAFCLGVIVLVFTLLVRDEFFRSTVRYTLQGIALVPIFLYAIKEEGSLFYKALNISWIKRIGVYSYTFYLAHYIVLNALNYNKVFNDVLITAIFVAILSLLYAAAINHFVEQPIKRWRLHKGGRMPVR